MTRYVFTPSETPSLAVQDSDSRFPVRRVFCVGRNYSEHAREMGHDPDREPPFFFMKPADAVVAGQGQIPFPPLTRELHHEVELVVAIGKAGQEIAPDAALDHVWGYGVGIDLTRRDIQAQAKKLGRPWDWAKGFDYSAPCSALRPVSAVGHPGQGKIWLNVNGTVRQTGNLDEQIWGVAEVISHASHSVGLQPGDLIFTGTPAGVGALQPGDVVTAGIDGIGQIEFSVALR
ncbi:FAA hydrolase family protein [Pseudomonas fluorescens]|uniref:FAA hydrolase family protein n=1 Tax=Pseudomonas fluorescens TaxID=294 RepID=A0A327MPM2_PSEFL|nr:fumarylacetoacetate hydrolase family protein [Pseudomonas fluorescens]RAI64837.1 FAA hydrolase family protein [Pseudomonas fluorescens]